MSWRGKVSTLTGRAREFALLRVLARFDPEIATFVALRDALADVVPSEATALDPEAYVPDLQLGAPGIDLRIADQLQLLERWRCVNRELYAALRADPGINLRVHLADRLYNGQFHTPDAEVYASLIVERSPRVIVEIGAGYSTRIARAAISSAALSTQLVVVDPQPRTTIEGVAEKIVHARIEEAVEELRLEPGAFLFIDSSHVARAGGDVALLLNQVVPRLPPGVIVHVHDAFIPWDYPPAYRRRLYSEQYVLQAMLAHAPRYRVVFTVHLMTRRYGEAMQRAFGPAVGAEPDYFGSSLWFEIVPV